MKDLKFTTIKRKSFFCCVFFYSEQGNLLMGIDKKIARRQFPSRLHTLLTHSIGPIKGTVL